MKKLAPLGMVSGVVFSSVLFAVFFQGKRASSEQYGPPPPPTPNTPPAPSVLPPPIPMPTGPVPTSPGWPEPPRPTFPMPGAPMVQLQPGKRYEIVADVVAFEGVSLTDAAPQILKALHIEGAKLAGYPKTVERAGVGEVTRVTFKITALAPQSFPIEQEMPFPGIGRAWLVSVKESS